MLAKRMEGTIPFQRGNVINGKYRLERMLAQGGMGAVWLARHLQLDTDLAIKFMAAEYAASSDARRRFEREARAAAQMRSQHVVQIYDYGLEGDTPYIAMELLEGEDLEARVVRERRLSLSSTLVIVTQVCKALRQAHSAGLIHRDLKPANLFLARQGDEEIVKILDFGIAKLTTPELAGQMTKTGTLLGSPHYMSPEQVRYKKEIDQRTDLWALGVIVFRCVTGQLPFQGEALGDLFVEICSDPIVAPSTIARDLGPEVDDFLFRALRRDPGERFQSASEFAEAFARVVSSRAGRPVATEVATEIATTEPPPWRPPGELSPRAIGGVPVPAFGHVPAMAAPPHRSPAAGAPPADAEQRDAATESDVPTLPMSSGTLSPAGRTLASPFSRERAGLSLGILGGLLVGGIVASLLLRSTAPSADHSHASPSAVPASTTAPGPAPPSAAPPVETANEAKSATPPTPTLSAATPSAVPGASKSEPPKRQPPPQKPSSPKSQKPRYDPRDHL